MHDKITILWTSYHLHTTSYHKRFGHPTFASHRPDDHKIVRGRCGCRRPSEISHVLLRAKRRRRQRHRRDEWPVHIICKYPKHLFVHVCAFVVFRAEGGRSPDMGLHTPNPFLLIACAHHQQTHALTCCCTAWELARESVIVLNSFAIN